MFKRKKLKPGFTLAEAIISTAITISIMGLVTSFFLKFSGFSNRTMENNDMVSELRMAQDRIMPELLPASKVLASFTIPSGKGYPTNTNPIRSNNTTVIFEAPAQAIKNNATVRCYVLDPADSTKLTAGFNTFILEYVNDCVSSKNPTLCNASSGNINRLRMTLFPASCLAAPSGTNNSLPNTRALIIRQSLNNFINSTDKDNVAYNMFTYYSNPVTNKDTTTQSSLTQVSLTSSSPQSDANTIAVIVIKLWAKKYTDRSYIFLDNTTQFALKNKL